MRVNVRTHVYGSMDTKEYAKIRKYLTAHINICTSLIKFIRSRAPMFVYPWSYMMSKYHVELTEELSVDMCVYIYIYI